MRRLAHLLRRRGWSTGIMTLAGFALALLCLALVGVAAYLSVNQLRRDADWARQTEEVISSLRLLLSHVTDAETAQRGFALTGEETYLEPYANIRPEVVSNLQTLRTLTADNSAQQRRLDDLEPLVARRMARIASQITLRRDEGFEAAKAAALSGIGKAIHDQIRAQVATMEAVEQQLLQKRRAETERSWLLARAIIVGGSVLGIGFLCLALRALERDLARRRAQAALAGRVSRMGSWSVALPGFDVTWSDEVCAIHEVPNGFAPPVADAIDFYAPEYRATITKAFGACVREGASFDLELQILTGRGRRLWVRTIGEARRDGAGAICVVQGAFQDITERKQIEAQARELGERLTTTLESLTDGFFTLDPEWCFTYVNAEAERMLGRPRAELLGQHIWTVFPEARGTISQEKYEAAVRDNVVAQFETFYPPFGVWFEARAFPSSQGLAVYFRDITDQQRAREALREAEEDFRTMANNISQLAWMADAQGSIFWYNDRWFNYSGTNLEEMQGWGWQKVHHPDHVAAVVAKISRCFQTGEVWDDTFPLRGRDGIYRWFLSRAVPIRDAAGKVLRWFGTNTDVTETKLLEAELAVARDRALESVRMKSEFLANMSHEIRTPMNGILGMTDLVLDTELTREQRHYLGMAKSSGHALLGLINDILDFSKIEAGKLELETIDFRLRETLESLLQPLQIRAEQKGLDLRAEIDAGVPDALLGDPLRLRQVLLNFLDNALKFTARGSVLVRVNAEAGDETERGLHFSITDTGIGIPAEKQALIFEAFAQVDGSTTRQYGGTGLGLAIVSQLVAQMRGKVWIESTVGAGTTFHFTAWFGASRESPPVVAQALAPEALTAVHATHGLRILLAEDNVINRALATALLEKRGHSLVHAATGREAVAAAAGETFDLIFMDVQMPDMDGLEATRRIRAAERATGRHTSIVAMTAHAMTGDRERCLSAGMDDYLSKPLQKSVLLRLLEGVREQGPPRGFAGSEQACAEERWIGKTSLSS